ncbi:hypothetical protein pb186bvf_017444 [Paramecium bursaria]
MSAIIIFQGVEKKVRLNMKVSEILEMLKIKSNLKDLNFKINNQELQIEMKTQTLQQLKIADENVIQISMRSDQDKQSLQSRNQLQNQQLSFQETITDPIPQAQSQIQQQLFKMDPNFIPQFDKKEIIVPVRPVKSNKPNNKIPQMAQSKIYEYDVKILDQGCTIEISKPNDEFKATLLIENTSQEESLKIKFQPDEVHNEPQYTLRIGTRELGGTKVSFLRDGKGFGVLWCNGLQSKFKFWLDE